MHKNIINIKIIYCINKYYFMHNNKFYLIFFHILSSTKSPVSVFCIDSNVIMLTIFFTFVNSFLISAS